MPVLYSNVAYIGLKDDEFQVEADPADALPATLKLTGTTSKPSRAMREGIWGSAMHLHRFRQLMQGVYMVTLQTPSR